MDCEDRLQAMEEHYEEIIDNLKKINEEEVKRIQSYYEQELDNLNNVLAYHNFV